MKTAKIELKIKHVLEIMNQDVAIASETKNGTRKRFVYNPKANEYRVYNGQEVLDSGQALEELLEVYNAL